MFCLGVLILGVWLQSYGAIPLQKASQPKRKLDCFPSGFEFAYDDVIDEGNFPDDRCWEIKCGTNGRLIKSITKCKHPKTNPPTTHSTNIERAGCTFENKKFKRGFYQHFYLFFFLFFISLLRKTLKTGKKNDPTISSSVIPFNENDNIYR